ncbi:MAG: hypothetical protein KC609_02795, partial [Myxococcales bacterium]|nr:hypothetical protein [Myxococcales bacterium]
MALFLTTTTRPPSIDRVAAIVALSVLLSISPALRARPRFTKTMTCPAFCAAAWDCLSPTLQKRLGGRAAYQTSCLASCPTMRANATIFAQSLALMEQRCLERDAERQKEQQKTPAPSPQKTPAPSPQKT